HCRLRRKQEISVLLIRLRSHRFSFHTKSGVKHGLRLIPHHIPEIHRTLGIRLKVMMRDPIIKPLMVTAMSCPPQTNTGASPFAEGFKAVLMDAASDGNRGDLDFCVSCRT